MKKALINARRLLFLLLIVVNVNAKTFVGVGGKKNDPLFGNSTLRLIKAGPVKFDTYSKMLEYKKKEMFEGRDSARAFYRLSVEDIQKTAPALYAVSLGAGGASGNYSTASGASSAEGHYSTSFGVAHAVGEGSTALGISTANGQYSIASGYYTDTEGDYSTALGFGTYVEGFASVAIGYYANTYGNYATAFGCSSSGGTYSTSSGDNSYAGGYASIAMGDNANAQNDGATAFGYYTTASGSNSTALGGNTIAASKNSLVLGRFNIGGGNANTWVDTDPLFEIGNGSSATNKANAVTVFKNGKVGIGTTAAITGNYKLVVEGVIGAQKIKVTQLGWADYVFAPDYKLPPLQDLETYIKQHQHLPDVPSADEVSKNGIDLGDNQAVLLKKIEELTLYVIELNKKNEELQKRLTKVEQHQ